MERRRSVFLVLITFFATFLTCVLGDKDLYFSHRSQDSSFLRREIAFGALLPLHVKDEHEGCRSAPKHQVGFLWLNALKYAVEEINRKWNRKLYNTSLALKVRDTCSDGQVALEQALDLANRYRKTVELSSSRQDNTGEDIKQVFGVISASENKDASTLLGLFKVPQIIFGRELRTVPQNSNEILQSVSVGFYKARALADLVKHFTWSAVSVIFSPDNRDDYEIFLRISNIEKLCIAVTAELISGEMDSIRFERVVAKLSSEPQSTAVILFTGDAETKELLQCKCMLNIPRQTVKNVDDDFFISGKSPVTKTGPISTISWYLANFLFVRTAFHYAGIKYNTTQLIAIRYTILVNL